MGVPTNHLNVTPSLMVFKVMQKKQQQQQQDNARKSAKEVGNIKYMNFTNKSVSRFQRMD